MKATQVMFTDRFHYIINGVKLETSEGVIYIEDATKEAIDTIIADWENEDTVLDRVMRRYVTHDADDVKEYTGAW